MITGINHITLSATNLNQSFVFYKEVLGFLDPNGHKLEIHVGTWKTRLEKYSNDPQCEILISNTELENIR